MDQGTRFGRNKKLRYKTDSFIIVPLRFRDKTIGVLCVTDREDGLEFFK